MTELEFKEFPEHPRLGRKIAVLDPRSRRFAAVGSLLADDAPIVTKTWRRYPRAFDQGWSSECTCYAAKGIINSGPLRPFLERSVRLGLDTTERYRYAQTVDEWEGEDYDGTSVLAAAKSFKEAGLIREFRWCFGTDDLLRTVSNYGPVEIGISWYESMFDTDEAGNLIVDFDSELAGGHAIEVHGVNTSNETVTLTNSWGESWGDRGRCYMTWADLDVLLADWGEAVTFT